MRLTTLVGFQDRDAFDGLTLPAWLNKKKIGQQPRLSEADRHFQEVMKEQEIQNEADRVAMLARVRDRLVASDDEVDAARRHRIVDKLSETELLLEKKIDD